MPGELGVRLDVDAPGAARALLAGEAAELDQVRALGRRRGGGARGGRGAGGGGEAGAVLADRGDGCGPGRGERGLERAWRSRGGAGVTGAGTS